MKGWLIIGQTWHYVRGNRTLCGKRAGLATMTAHRLLEMTPGLPNCDTCQRSRLAECAPNMRIENGEEINGTR